MMLLDILGRVLFLPSIELVGDGLSGLPKCKGGVKDAVRRSGTEGSSKFP